MNKPRILGVDLISQVDNDPDTSFLGDYTDDASDPWLIDRRSGEYIANLPDGWTPPPRGSEKRFFNPYAGGAPRGSDDYQEYGKRDFARMESLCAGDWHFIGIHAEATVQLHPRGVEQDIRSGGVWGIESDAGDAFIAQNERDELDELRLELRALGFTDADISAAFGDFDAINRVAR